MCDGVGWVSGLIQIGRGPYSFLQPRQRPVCPGRATLNVPREAPVLLPEPRCGGKWIARTRQSARKWAGKRLFILASRVHA
jgi:hypothetical protein